MLVEDAVEVPYVDLSIQHNEMLPEIMRSLETVISSGRFILSEKVKEFEESFARFIGVRYAIGVNSGTDALVLSLRALGIGPGDEVITVPNSYITSASSIIIAGAKPVFVDVDRKTWNIDPKEIEKNITSKTKAIITVSLYGLPTNITEIMKIAKKHNLTVIDDSAETFLSSIDGELYSNQTDITVYSFERSKHMTSGSEGGMVTTNNEHFAERVRKFAGIGYRGLKASAGRTSLSSEIYQNPDYERFDEIGFNYRMNCITAAM